MVEWRESLEQILLWGVAAVDPERLVSDHLRRVPRIANHPSVVLLAVGKAAAGMTRGAIGVLKTPTRGLAVCSTDTDLDGIEVIVGDHPVPGERSFEAGRRLMRMAAAAGPGDLVLVLLSGGASAMAEVPTPGVTEQQIIEANSSLLTSGRPITEVNEQRASLSALKNGGITGAARPARVVTLAISDIADASPDVIGSGPSIGSDVFTVLADGATAARAAAQACREKGLAPELLAAPIAGAASEVGKRIGRAAISLRRRTAIIGFGETTVHVDGAGRGGRNQELALAAALEISGSSALVGSIGTDGIDGPTANAGAIVDGTTVGRAQALGLDTDTHLASHDSATLLEATRDVIVTGPTDTNVGDLVVAIKP